MIDNIKIQNLLTSKYHMLTTKLTTLSKTKENIDNMVEQFKGGDKVIQSLLIKTYTSAIILEHEIESLKLDISRLEAMLR